MGVNAYKIMIIGHFTNITHNVIDVMFMVCTCVYAFVRLCPLFFDNLFMSADKFVWGVVKFVISVLNH